MLASGRLHTSSGSASCPSHRRQGIWSQAERPWSPAAPAAGRLLSCSGPAGEEKGGEAFIPALCPGLGTQSPLPPPAQAQVSCCQAAVLAPMDTFWGKLVVGRSIGRSIPCFHTRAPHPILWAEGQSRKRSNQYADHTHSAGIDAARTQCQFAVRVGLKSSVRGY